MLLKLQTIQNHNIHYLRRYVKFINSIKIIPAEEYGENHHILPVSLFPEYKLKGVAPWNQKRIGPREHYICHWLLYKAFPGNRQMINAFFNMCNFKRGRIKINSVAYEKLKKEHAANVSAWHPEFWNEDNRKIIGAKQKLRWINNPQLAIDQSNRMKNRDRAIYSAANKLSANTPEEKLRRSKVAKENMCRPWFHPKIKSNLKHQVFWASIDIMYDAWIQNNKCGYWKLAQHVITDRKLSGVVLYFKEHGDPRLDTKWVDWKKS